MYILACRDFSLPIAIEMYGLPFFPGPSLHREYVLSDTHNYIIYTYVYVCICVIT